LWLLRKQASKFDKITIAKTGLTTALHFKKGLKQATWEENGLIIM
jgi:hypothetical protein